MRCVDTEWILVSGYRLLAFQAGIRLIATLEHSDARKVVNALIISLYAMGKWTAQTVGRLTESRVC